MTVFTLMFNGCQQIKHMPNGVIADDSMLSSEPPHEMDSDATDAFDLIDAEVDGDSLRVKVSYSGGCALHEFKLLANDPALRSMPPQQLLRIEHAANADPCRALIEEVRSFDLSAFQASPRGVMLLRLNEWELTYTYD